MEPEAETDIPELVAALATVDGGIMQHIGTEGKMVSMQLVKGGTRF
jgi:hypothetical protein